MTTNHLDLSRRKLLSAMGTVGGAAALGGASTMAYFSDEEQFANNQLVGGRFDVKAGWQSNYSDWSADETGGTAESFLQATTTSVEPDDDGDRLIDDFSCATDIGAPRVFVRLLDVKPGDFGFVNFDLLACDNPAHLWLNARLELTASGTGPNSENDLTESERNDPDEASPFGIQQLDGELGGRLRVRPYYIAPGAGATSTEVMTSFFGSTDLSGEAIMETFFSTFGLDSTDAPTLLEFVNGIGIQSPLGIPLDGEPVAGEFGTSADVTTDPFILFGDSASGATILDGADVARDCFAGQAKRFVGLAWGLPLDHANEIQTDSVVFSLGFQAQQCRHNDGSGSETLASVGLAPQTTTLDGSADGGYGTVTVDHVRFSGVTGPVKLPSMTDVSDGPRFLLGLHADGVGSGAPDARDSLVGLRPLPPGSHSDVEVTVGPTPFTDADGDGDATNDTLDESDLLGEQTITAKLWHGSTDLLSPSGPIHDRSGRPVSSSTSVTFE